MSLVLVGGTVAAYKLNKKDVEKIKQHTNKSADDLTVEELKAAMKRLNIKQLELTDEDEFAAKKGRKFVAFVIPTAGDGRWIDE